MYIFLHPNNNIKMTMKNETRNGEHYQLKGGYHVSYVNSDGVRLKEQLLWGLSAIIGKWNCKWGQFKGVHYGTLLVLL